VLPPRTRRLARRADAYLTKPIDITGLLEVVGSIIDSPAGV
jgi:hypothetical protein